MNGRYKLIFSIVFITVCSILITGCPGKSSQILQAERFGISPDNLLPIPGLDTIFEYDGDDIEWNIKDHPRILATPGAIESLRLEQSNETRRGLIRAADENKALIDADPTFREATAPITLAWAYLLTDDEKYMDGVRKSLNWLTDFPPIVKVPEGANIGWLEQAISLGGVYDLLYDKFTERERESIEKVLRETVFHTLAYKVTEYDKDINFWAMEPQTNYYLVFHAVAGLVAIDLMGIEPAAEELAEHSWTRIQESMKFMDDENGWREGLTYLDFCWGQSTFYFFLGLEKNSDRLPFDDPWFVKSASWAYYGALPNRETIACFGDNEPENYSVGSYLYRAGVLLNFNTLIRESQGTEDVIDLALDLDIFAAACLNRTPDIYFDWNGFGMHWASRYFPGIEWAVIRHPIEPRMTSVGDDYFVSEDDFYLAIKSGFAGYDHNHLDQGSMILAAYGEILLSDPGRGGPDIIRQDPAINCLFEAGLGHNTLIIGDGCYDDLKLFPDNPDYFAEKGEITSHNETDEYIQYTTDNSGLYPTEPLVDFRRTFIYIKPGIIEGAKLGALIIADRVGFYEEVEHSMLFHTPGTVEIIDNARATLTNGIASLEYFGFCSIDTVDKQERQLTTWDIRDSTCYYRSTDGPARNSDWVHVLIPRLNSSGAENKLPEPEILVAGFGNRIKWDDFSIDLLLKPDVGWVVSDLPAQYSFGD